MITETTEIIKSEVKTHLGQLTWIVLLTIFNTPPRFNPGDSIAHGIALGFIAYVVIKALSGRASDLNAGSIVIGALSFLYYIV